MVTGIILENMNIPPSLNIVHTLGTFRACWNCILVARDDKLASHHLNNIER